MPAEHQITAGREDRTDLGPGSAAIASGVRVELGSGRRRRCQRCGHGVVPSLLSRGAHRWLAPRGQREHEALLIDSHPRQEAFPLLPMSGKPEIGGTSVAGFTEGEQGLALLYTDSDCV